MPKEDERGSAAPSAASEPDPDGTNTSSEAFPGQKYLAVAASLRAKGDKVSLSLRREMLAPVPDLQILRSRARMAHERNVKEIMELMDQCPLADID